MATAAQIASKALQHMGIIGAGESPNTDDQTLMTDLYESLYWELRSKHLVTWGSGDNIPEQAEIPVRNILAFYAADSFGLVGDEMEKVSAIGVLRSLDSNDFTGEPVQADYF